MDGEVFNAGKFISRGRGRHPERVIDSDELIIVLHGELDIFEEEQRFLVREGEWLLLRRGRRHGGAADYPGNLSFFWLHFRGWETIIDQLPSHGRTSRRSPLAEYAQLFLAEQSRPEPDPEVFKLLLKLMFKELSRSPAADVSSSGRTPLVVEAENFINLHALETITPDSISRMLHCNRDYLGRIYARVHGETISAAIIRRRIEHAARLLTGENLSIKEVALASGFNDPAYFRRMFRRIYSLTPGEFRRRRREVHVNSR